MSWAFGVISSAAALTDPERVNLSASSNIASGAATATTAQLTAPSGKSTSDFQAGKISDDTNPLPSIDLNNLKYTELEWSIITASGLSSNDEIEFRITNNGTVLDTYTVTPKITISSAGTLYYKSIDGTLPAATGAVIKKAIKGLAGVMPFAVGGAIRLISVSRTGAMPAPYGSASKKMFMAFAGAMPSASGSLGTQISMTRTVTGAFPAPVGGTVKLISRSLTGGMPNAAGAIQRRTARTIFGTLPAPSGSVFKLTSIIRSGIMPAAMGGVAAVLTLTRSLSGALGAISGELQTQIVVSSPYVRVKRIINNGLNKLLSLGRLWR